MLDAKNHSAERTKNKILLQDIQIVIIQIFRTDSILNMYLNTLRQ